MNFKISCLFFHLTDNTKCLAKGDADYDPRNKLGTLFTSLCNATVMLSIDKGCIPFKGNVAFKCYNPKKIEKYHIKSYKLVDSTNNYCLRFELYVGKLDKTPLTDYGKVHDLVFRI